MRLRKSWLAGGTLAICCAGVSASPAAFAEDPTRSPGYATPTAYQQPGGVEQASNMVPARLPTVTPASAARVMELEERLSEVEAQLAGQKPAEKKADDDGYKVGSDLKINVRWNPANGVTFETPNKDFVSHIGVRINEDSVFFQEDRVLRGAGGIGEMQDGTFFRRVRPSWDGKAYEVMEWNIELALEQTNQNIPNLDEAWVGVTELPYVGNVRVGHMKVPQGFEAGMVSSSKAFTFLERASYSEAFYQDFAPGVWVGNSILDQRMTWSSMWYKQENPNVSSVPSGASTGAAFGDGKFGYTGRLTALPVFENDGRQLVHLGVSGTWRAAVSADPGIAGPTFVQFRARPEMRDAIGAFGGAGPGNSARFVDTGALNSEAADVLGSELFIVQGPFSVQSEYGWATAEDVIVGGVRRGNLTFNGGYLELSYFLTGENRTYDRRFGRLGSTYIASPFTPFWLVRMEDGCPSFGSGAWEIAARYSYLNLNQGVVRGGIETGVSLGVNWYLNTNLKIQSQYLHQTRDDLAPGQAAGDIDGFGTRVQFFF